MCRVQVRGGLGPQGVHASSYRLGRVLLWLDLMRFLDTFVSTRLALRLKILGLKGWCHMYTPSRGLSTTRLARIYERLVLRKFLTTRTAVSTRLVLAVVVFLMS